MVAYSTEKLQEFKGTTCLWIIFMFYMILCIGLIPSIVILRKEDYDITDQIESVVSVKVYGVVKSNFSDDEFNAFVSPAEREMYNRLWDPVDYVLPQVQGQPSEVFITTNLVIKQNQTRSRCPEDPNIKNAMCDPSDPKHCRRHIGYYNGNGIPTHNCVPTKCNNGTLVHSCEIEAWCPVIRYNDIPLKNDQSLLRAVNESVLLIATSIRFPQFNYSPLPEKQFRNYKYCNSSDLRCPPWKLGEVVSTAHVNKSIEEVYKYGAVLALHVHWDECNDKQECNPVYVPTDFENPDIETYQYHTFVYNDITDPSLKRRTLVKAYGVRLIVLVSGTAKRFRLSSFLTSCAKYGSIIGTANALFAFCVLSVCYRSCSWRRCCLGNEEDPYSEVYEEDATRPEKLCKCLCTALTSLKECVTCQCGRKTRTVAAEPLLVNND